MVETYLDPSKMTIVVVGDKAEIADQIAPYETQQQPQINTDKHR
jgi:hypothetical protein